VSQPLVAVSFGAGHQTTALLVLVVEGRLPRPDAWLFADTGNEHRATYDYLLDYSIPYATANGIRLTVLGADWRSAHYRADLETYCLDHHMLPGTFLRWCTDRYKVKPIHRYQKQVMGATAENPVESWIGISTDEIRRAVPSSEPTAVKRYPLIELGMSRADCDAVILAAGLPLPPKSGCWFCPFKSRAAWQAQKRTDPLLFMRSLALERNAYPKHDGRPRYLPAFGSLEAVAAQDEIPGFDEAIEAEAGCVTGHCFV
jgi:hypothetical protein